MIELIQTLTSITQFSVPNMSEIITILFQICCGIIYLIGEATGMGYELANLVIFVVVHPLITLIFFYLWRKAQIKNRAFREFSKISHAQRSSEI